MVTTDSVLRRGLERHGDELTLTLDPAFQGLPDTAHGGSVLAAFHLLAGEPGPRQVFGVYRKRVPLGVPLRLVTSRRADALECRLLDASNMILVAGGVGPPAAEAPAESPVVRSVAARTGEKPAISVLDEGAPPPAAGHLLPVSSTCFACGVDNPLGLGVQLAYDDATVGGAWHPRDVFRAAATTLAPVALTTMLDEAAFWLGALASGESGMTTELAVTLPGEVPFGAAITVAGSRARVRARADDPRYWDTEIGAWDEAGRLVARAHITFVAVRGAARRLATWLLRSNPPDVVRAVFPTYT
jgi:hypothetical protein